MGGKEGERGRRGGRASLHGGSLVVTEQLPVDTLD